MILKRSLIPMQDDTENGGGRVGMLRPDAATNAAYRNIESRSNQRVFETQRRHRVCGPKPERDLRLGARCAGGPGVRPASQEGTGCDSRVPERDDRTERATNGAADSEVPGNGVVELKPYRRHEFTRKYTARDVALLAEVDRAHEGLSGPATRWILKRE